MLLLTCLPVHEIDLFDTFGQVFFSHLVTPPFHVRLHDSLGKNAEPNQPYEKPGVVKLLHGFVVVNPCESLLLRHEVFEHEP